MLTDRVDRLQAAQPHDHHSAGATVGARPHPDQTELDPVQPLCGPPRTVLEACDRHGVALEAYSPLGTGRHLGDRRVARIAERLGRTPAQVLIRWSLQRDLVVLPKSTHRERIEQNAQVFDFELSDEDMGALDGLDRTGGTDRGLERPWW